MEEFYVAKFLTLNTHSWLGEDSELALEILGKQILAADYDVIALQEVNQRIDSPDVLQAPYTLENQHHLHEDNYALKLVEYLKERGVNYYFTWAYGHIGYDEYHEGVALLSKQPFTSERSVLTSNVDDEYDYHTRRALIAKTQVAGQEMCIVSGHFSWWKNDFKSEWHRLEATLATEEAPLVIMGDFNNPENTPGHELILASPLKLKDSHLAAKEVTGGATILQDIDGWENNDKALRIDYIFVSQQLEVTQSHVLFDGKEQPLISDHFGVECVIK